ncbi:MAG TPA: O-antigen polysaccharide polymerase Wzy [Candidatus Limnocylindria bacterium]|jgi:hypothetical protein|nr:O-antigen polysaccharide polymerase Wzy [Candidatus Limnocylindria bacterium]HTL66478.1 O-antigen polysaccharide polymerase Wzy [Lacunisphaera sp.]
MEDFIPPPAPEETVADYSLLGGGHAERGRKLFATGLALLAASLVYLAFRARIDDPLHLFLGLATFTLAALPFLLWARSGGGRFPVFETVLGLTANAYAVPLLNAREQLAGFPAGVITTAGFAVLIYQLSAILTYVMVRGLPGRSRFWRESIITNQIERMIVYGMILSTLYIWISTFTTWIPDEIFSVLRAVFFGIGVLCTFVSAQRWGRGAMAQSEKTVFLCTLVPQLIIMCVSLILIGAISLLGIAFLGYISGGKRIPWVALAAVFIVFAVLHTGKGRMRAKYWEEDSVKPTTLQLPAFYTEWVTDGLQAAGEENTSLSQRLLERTSLMHILCLVVDSSPDRQPYLYGKTYTYVLPQLIPRLFWPEKPRSHIATYELGIYYGLQTEEATETTTIAFGLLTEAYANFGLLGAILLGVAWGFAFKKMQVWSTFSPMFSLAGLTMIILTAWSFNAELTMAAWVSSLEQALVVVLGLPLVLRSIFGL